MIREKIGLVGTLKTERGRSGVAGLAAAAEGEIIVPAAITGLCAKFRALCSYIFRCNTVIVIMIIVASVSNAGAITECPL